MAIITAESYKHESEEEAPKGRKKQECKKEGPKGSGYGVIYPVSVIWRYGTKNHAQRIPVMRDYMVETQQSSMKGKRCGYYFDKGAAYAETLEGLKEKVIKRVEKKEKTALMEFSELRMALAKCEGVEEKLVDAAMICRWVRGWKEENVTDFVEGEEEEAPPI